MSLGVRAGKTAGRLPTRLLLARPGHPPEPVVATRWRALLAGPNGDVAPEAAFATLRAASMSSKPDKALLAALAADDLPAIAAIAAAGGDTGIAANLLLGLRSANDDPATSAQWLTAALAAGQGRPNESKFLQRYLPTLQVCTLLAPGVPAITPADAQGTVLLLAEMINAQSRCLEAVSLLVQQPLTPAIGLALAATYLVIGQNEAVVKMTDGLENLDDLTALCLVARGVALRSSGRMDEAIMAVDAAVNVPTRHPGMISAALAERANMLRLRGDDLAAQADCDRITALEGGATPEALSPREIHDEPAASIPTPGSTDPEAMAAARLRVRRHIAMSGAPGTFGGRHHHTYQPEVEAMLAAGQFDAAGNLLLGLLDAVEDEAEVNSVPIDPTFYLTLADLFSHQGERAEYLAIMERFEVASQRFGTLSDAQELAEAIAAIEALAQRDGIVQEQSAALVDQGA